MSCEILAINGLGTAAPAKTPYHVSNSNPDNNNSLLAAVAGEIYKMELDGTVIGKFGKPGKQLGEFSTVHAIDCRNPDELIVVEITAWRAQKIRLKAITPSSTR